MAWLGIDKDGTELIYDLKDKPEGVCHYQFIRLPAGSIKKLIGRELKKKDMPVELLINDLKT
jgi:hypothetical protein